MSWFDDAVDAVEDAAKAAADAAAAAAQAAADAAAAAAAAAAQAAEDAAKAAAAAAEAAFKAAVEAADQAKELVVHPAEAVNDIAHAAGDAVDTVNQFIADHSSAIIAGAEVVGTVALYASGVGAPVAAIISGAATAGNEAAHGADAGDALLDGLAAAGDKLLPGSGDAVKAVVHGIENGETPGEIAREAGLNGVASNGGPLLGYGATFANDVSHGKGAGQILLDAGSQYGNDASGAGTDHSNPLGQVFVAGANDINDGKSIAQFGLDVGKIYLHDAAGGASSPTGQLTDTALDDIGQGKSWKEIGADLLHQAEDMANRVEHGAPGALGDAINGSGLPGASLGATLVNDVIQGKTPEQTAIDLGKDVVHEVGDQPEVKDIVSDTGIDPSTLDHLKPYGETLANDVVDGKSPDEIAIDLLKQGAKDVGSEAGIDLGSGDKAAEKLFDDLTHGKDITDAAKGALDAIAHSGDGTDSGDHPPGWLVSSLAGDGHHAVTGADVSSDAELNMIELQSVVSERQEAVQETTQLVQSLNDATQSIIHNIGDGSSSGNGGSGDGSNGSDGDHPPGWPFAAHVDDTHHAGAAEAELTATTDAVDAPSFVSNLVDGTFDHIVQSSVQHMSDAAPASAIEGDFWSEAAQAVNGSSATTIESGAVVFSSMSNAIDPVAHSDGSGESMSDFSHAITSVETAHTPVIDHFVAPPIEIVHAPEFATHMHL